MIEDLPVAVLLPPPLDQQVAAWVERDLGWQVVDPTGSLPPALALATAACETLPWIAVTDGRPPDDTVTALLREGAEDIVAWPDDRARIPLIARRIDLHRRETAGGPRLVVAGIAGGVGTSTVALAVGGLLAWRGASALVIGGDGLLALAGVDGERSASGSHTPVPGVGGLSVAARHADSAAVAWSGDVTVVDAGTRVTADITLVVARADGSLRRAGRLDQPVLVNGDAPVGPGDIPRLLGRQPLARLPHSARVARAGLHGRVPTALPGRWLATVGDALRRLDGARP